MAVSFLMSPLPALARESLLRSILASGNDEGNKNKSKVPTTFVPILGISGSYSNHSLLQNVTAE